MRDGRREFLCRLLARFTKVLRSSGKDSKSAVESFVRCVSSNLPEHDVEDDDGWIRINWVGGRAFDGGGDEMSE